MATLRFAAPPPELSPPRIGGQPKSFDTFVQDIASAAHKRGVNLMKGETVVGTIEAAELCRTIRAARERQRGREQTFNHVGQLAAGIALRLGQRGAVQVSRASWNLLRGYASQRRAEGLQEAERPKAVPAPGRKGKDR